MKIPRPTISALMALVLLVALDAGVMKAFLAGPISGPDLMERIVFGSYRWRTSWPSA